MTDQPQGPPPTEEELRAAFEAELARLRVEEVLIQTVVTLLNLGAHKAGMVPGGGERDMEQVRKAIDALRALLPVAEPDLGPNAGPLRDALAQLQLAYAQLAGGGEGAASDPGPRSGGPGGAGQEPPAPDAPEQPGPAQSSGRLWVPGQ